MIRLTTPLADPVIGSLRSGDQVLLSGVLYTARDAAHKRLFEALNRNERLPFDLAGQIIYYVGPTPPPPGKVIGSAGPTTSYRMDAYAPLLIEHGLKGMIGKGERNAAVREAMKKHHALYFAATGGAGALLSKCIVKAEVIAYPDLGPEAIRRLEVMDFPAVVINDIEGGDLYGTGREKYRRDWLIDTGRGRAG
jgi:fumarate hydratase subunit beta